MVYMKELEERIKYIKIIVLVVDKNKKKNKKRNKMKVEKPKGEKVNIYM